MKKVFSSSTLLGTLTSLGAIVIFINGTLLQIRKHLTILLHSNHPHSCFYLCGENGPRYYGEVALAVQGGSRPGTQAAVGCDAAASSHPPPSQPCANARQRCRSSAIFRAPLLSCARGHEPPFCHIVCPFLHFFERSPSVLNCNE